MADEYAVKPSEHARRIDTIYRNLKQCFYAPYDSQVLNWEHHECEQCFYVPYDSQVLNWEHNEIRSNAKNRG